MLKEHFAFFQKLEMLGDLSLALVAFQWIYPYEGLSPVLPACLLIWAVLLHLLGAYESFRIKHVGDILLAIWSAAFIAIGICGFAAYLLKYQDLSRVFVILGYLSTAGMVSLERIAVMVFLRSIRKRGYNFRHILIVGTGLRAQQFMELLVEHSEWGLKIVGLVDEDRSLIGKRVHGFGVIGTLKDVPEIVHDRVVDEVVFVAPRSWHHKIKEVVAFCETEGIRVHHALDMFDLKFAKARPTDLDGFLLLTLDRTPMKVWHLFVKEVFDVLLAGVMLLVLLPLFIFVAVAVKMTSKGPVFHKQTRCGLKGRPFTLYKFRTMVENAEELLPRLSENNEMSGPVFKMKNDPRITPLGKMLRKTSIDELPQLWNVLKRDMSIVGPRPPLPQEVKRYDSWQRRRLSMRPGITCLWQVQGRNKIWDFDEWTRLDLHYIDHWSFWSDFKILARTVPAVIFGVGAK